MKIKKLNVEILSADDTWQASAHNEFISMIETSMTPAPIQVDETDKWRYYSYNTMIYRVRK